LDKKRVALWNKPTTLRTSPQPAIEVYECPCGFRIQNEAVDTGNKVAAHLLECNFKYCEFSLPQDEEDEVEEKLPIVEEQVEMETVSIQDVV
jgi:hypothetical protein